MANTINPTGTYICTECKQKFRLYYTYTMHKCPQIDSDKKGYIRRRKVVARKVIQGFK